MSDERETRPLDRSKTEIDPLRGAMPGVRSGSDEVAAFVADARATDPARPRARLVFALDATMSRQATWDRAAQLQAEMFEATGRIGGLDVQLVYFRGFNECRASRFVRDGRSLADLMARIDCRAGRTQIGRVLRHALATAREAPLAALVYVGDALEESIDDLAGVAGELALHGTKAFVFQEGADPGASRGFSEIARLTGGAHLGFGPGSANDLAGLLRAVAAYAAGGVAALEDLLGRGDRDAAALLAHLR